jgi:hypothetical protein
VAGTSSYPGALDNFSALSPTNLGDNDSTGRNHGERHDDLEAAVEAVQAELGINPAGTAATVVARLDNLPTLSDATPQALGTAAAGTASAASRSDHVHAEPDLSAYVPNSTVTAKADLLVASASATVDNLAVGTDDQYLVADSGETLGLKWATFPATPVTIGVACSDETTDLATGTAVVTFRMPHAMTLTGVRAGVTTAPVGSTIIVDINEAGTTVLSTKLSIDASEKTSTTAASAAVISDSALADDAEITIDIDQVGSTTAGAGLKVWLIGTKA